MGRASCLSENESWWLQADGNPSPSEAIVGLSTPLQVNQMGCISPPRGAAYKFFISPTPTK